MVRAVWNGAVIAESDDVIVVDGYYYFPRSSVNADLLVESAHTSVCIWKGRARYYSIVVDGLENPDAAWYYPKPSRAAARVKDRIGFWRGVRIEDDPADGAAEADDAGLLDRIRGRFARSAAARTPSGQHDPTELGGSSAVVDLDDATFEAGTEGGWTIVDFWAAWCRPCRTFGPVFEQAADTDTTSLRYARCNVDTSPKAATAVGILSIPTVVLFDPEGNEAGRIAGIPSRKDFDALRSRAATAESEAAAL